MNKRHIFGASVLAGCLVLCFGNLYAENIDPDDDGSQYAYGENVGWLNFEPSQGPGVHVSQTDLSGYVWTENVGWINLSPSSYGGVVNDGAGNLSGYVWAENAGWISFSCDNTISCGTVNYGVTIDSDGNFDGWAWGENIGWIHFQSASPVAYKVKVCVVNLENLLDFAAQWLATGDGIPADLTGNQQVDLLDFGMLAEYWLDYCPSDWPL